MVNLSLLPLIGILSLQMELQSFVDVLLNGVPKQTVRIVHSNETADWVQLIVSAMCFQQHVIEVDNFEAEHAETVIENLKFKYKFIMIVLLSESMVDLWINVYNSLNPKAKIIWLFNSKLNEAVINAYVIQLQHNLNWHNFVLVDLQKDLLQINHKNILQNYVQVTSHRDKRFQVPGKLLDYLFNNTFTYFDDHLLYVYGEPNAPNVALMVSHTSAEKYVAGSDISLAVMIGRYLNASVRWIAGWEHRAKFSQLPKEQRIPFAKYIYEEIRQKANITEIMPWQLNSNKNE